MYSSTQDLVHRSEALFAGEPSSILPSSLPSKIREAKLAMRLRFNYVRPMVKAQDEKAAADKEGATTKKLIGDSKGQTSTDDALVELPSIPIQREQQPSMALVARSGKNATSIPRPKWHAPWELAAVLSGHLGWVRAIAFDPSNEWFVTGSADRTIKCWDFAKCCAGVDGGLKLTLTGHIDTVRGLAVSPRHPYMFSVGEDKLVKCWDLEYNKVIRHYHGHLSAVYCVTIHPTLDILITGGRDSVARVWDMRTKQQIHLLGGHTEAVGTVISNSVDPQIITGSFDSTIKLWDLAAGKCMVTLTHHKKAVRSICANPRDFSFISASADNIKKWQSRDGRFLKNFTGHNSIVNSLAINDDGVVFSGGDNGSICFWDYETGYCFQRGNVTPQAGSLDAEAGVFASTFDYSGTRLLTCEADKSIKVWRESPSATDITHPVDLERWESEFLKSARF